MDTTILHTPSYDTKMLTQTGMKSRKNTALKKMEAVSKTMATDQTQVNAFLSYIASFTPEQQAVVTLLLIEEGHANLLDQVLTHNHTPYTASQLVPALVFKQSNEPTWDILWPLLEKYTIAQTALRAFTRLPDALPIQAWEALRSVLAQTPPNSFSFNVPDTVYMTATHFSGVPTGSYDKGQFGKCVEALYNHFDPTNTPLIKPGDILPMNIPGLFATNSFQLMIGLLSGWPINIVRAYFPHVSATKDGALYGHLYEKRFNMAKSTHDWMEIAQEAKALTDAQRHDAIATLKEIHTMGGYGTDTDVRKLKAHPTLSALLQL